MLFHAISLSFYYILIVFRQGSHWGSQGWGSHWAAPGSRVPIGPLLGQGLWGPLALGTPQGLLGIWDP